MEGSHVLGKRLERQDESFWTDLKNLHKSCGLSKHYIQFYCICTLYC